ncbi:MAG TPA: glycosyltransferase family 2 protein, partial [Thermoanaerobaculia bacterium]|nr:glycosyltransferase family 2 protein [Thermoanaerobaculia bacterium]
PVAAGTPRAPIAVLVATRDEEANLERCLRSVHGFAEQLFVLDSESRDGTVEIARRYADRVETLAYDHGRIIPWIFQWGLDHLPIASEWVLILEADQALTPALRAEIAARLAAGPREDGFYIRRRQIFRGRPIRFGGYGGKVMLKLFRRGRGELDPHEQDTRVYVRGAVGRLRAPLEEWNRKEDEILFYLQKHLRYAEAFAREELARRRGEVAWKTRPRLLGHPDERVLWRKDLYYRLPLFVRPLLYFVYRYVLLLGVLDGRNGFVFHTLQAFWFRLVVDIRLEELLRAAEEPAR